jgi:hypothetical protein
MGGARCEADGHRHRVAVCFRCWFGSGWFWLPLDWKFGAPRCGEGAFFPGGLGSVGVGGPPRVDPATLCFGASGPERRRA